MQNKRRSPEERARLVSAFRASGLKQREFAQREGITVSALQNWLYCPKGRKTARPSAGFVRVLGARPDGNTVVRLGTAVSIEFAATPEANYLAALARALTC
jgi:hypothetical protein